MDESLKKYRIYFLAAILILAAFLRLYQITILPPGLYPDEAMNGNNALEALSAGDFKVFYPENNGREGLFINIQAVFLKVLIPSTFQQVQGRPEESRGATGSGQGLLAGGNPEPWMLRLPSAIFGLLTVLGVYFLSRELFRRPALFEKNVSEAERAWFPSEARKSEAESQAASERLGERDRGFSRIMPDAVALLSAFLLATSFWHINFSRIGFRAIMAPFFLTWAIYFLLKSLNANRYALYAIVGGIFYGLGFYSYIAYRATPILIFIILFLYWLKAKRETDAKQTRNKILLSASCFLFSTFIVAAPLGLYFLNQPQDFFGRTAQVSVFSSPTPLKDLGMNILKTAGMFNFAGDWNWRHNYVGRPELFWPVGILFIIGVIVGLISVLKNSKHEARNSKQYINSNVQNSKLFRIWDLENLNLFRISNFGFRILFGWLIIAALPVVISNEGMPHALRAILMVPPAFILAGIGGIRFYEFIIAKVRNHTKVRKFLLFAFYLLLLLLVVESYTTYFILWGKNQNTQGAFAADYARIGRELRDLPKEMPKYVVVEAGGVDVRGIPMPAQTVMFLTDTFTPEKQKEKNLYYILPNQTGQIPKNSYTVILK